MKEKIHIRQAELQDLDAIERIELENFSEEEAIAREILKRSHRKDSNDISCSRVPGSDFRLFRRTC